MDGLTIEFMEGMVLTVAGAEWVTEEEPSPEQDFTYLIPPMMWLGYRNGL
jgi:hypothetical protein